MNDATAKIRVLSPHLVNKIAAGEVIERPASVVKELVENALDAGATRISVAIEGGGKRTIAVSDDGGGMSAEDLALAFVPHATSKIATDEDLFRIFTMGFRGEALASIASISHAHIRTRRRKDESGHEIEATGETLGALRPCAAAPGTTVTIRDLFFNTPARRKFLKGDPTELGHISEALTRIALPAHRIGFQLSHNGRTVLDLPPAETLRQRACDIFDAELSGGLLEIRPDDGEIRVRGLVGTPAAARSTARWQYVFLNGRYIRDRNLSHALKEAYRGLVDPSRQPVAFLFIDMPPEAVDVNVHPCKVEVRFRDSQQVHSHVLSALRETLQRSELRPSVHLPTPAALDPSEPPNDPRRQGLRDALAEFFKSRPATQAHLQFPTQHDRPEREEYAAAPAPAGRPISAAPPPLPPRMDERKPAENAFSAPVPRSPPPMVSSPMTAAAASAAASFAPAPIAAGKQPDVLQVHNTYLVVSDEEGVVIIDQHALHERVLYEQLLRRLSEGKLEGQRLLLPMPMKVTPQQRALLEEHRELLDRLGIEVTEFGPDAMAIQRFPSFLNKLEPPAFLADAMDALGEYESGAESEKLVHELLDRMACKAAVKAGDSLTQAEIAALLAQRQEVAKPTACPHGRPTQIRLTLKDLEKQFKRT